MYIMCLSKGLSAIEQSISEGLLPNKKIGFIATAGETYENPYFVEESRQRLRLHGLDLIELDITNEIRENIVNAIETVDALYIAGGNSFWLLQQLNKKDLITYIRDRVQNGLPYFGESAGAVLLSESIEPAAAIDSPEDATELEVYNGLGLINFFPLPHVGKEKYKATFDKFIEDNQDKIKIVQYTDEQAIIIKDNNSTYEIIASPIEALEL